MSSSSNGIPSFHINGMEGGVVGSSLMGFLCNLPSKGKKKSLIIYQFHVLFTSFSWIMLRSTSLLSAVCIS